MNEREISQLGRPTDGAKLPGDLHAAWEHTSAGGELGELRGLTGRALSRYCRESAANSDGAVSAGDLDMLHDWLVEHAPRPAGRPRRSSSAATDAVKVRLTASESEAFAAAAGAQPVSAWLRGLGRVAAKLDRRAR